MICRPSQTIVGFAVPAVPGHDTSPVIDCNLARKRTDLRDAEIARLRKQVEDLVVAAGARWRRMATSTTCGETWEQYALERDAEIATLRAQRDRAIRLACKMTQACVDSTRFNRGASFSLDDSDEAVKLAALLSTPSASPVRLDDTGETR